VIVEKEVHVEADTIEEEKKEEVDGREVRHSLYCIFDV